MARRVLAVRWALTNRGTLEVKALIVRTKALMVRKVLSPDCWGGGGDLATRLTGACHYQQIRSLKGPPLSEKPCQ